MGFILPSGNQLIWIRPTFQDSVKHNLAAGDKIRHGTRAVDALKWGDENEMPDSRSWFSIAYDPDNGYWIVRHNERACQGFLKAVTGATKRTGAAMEDLEIYSNGYLGGSQPALVMMNYQYVTANAARKSGDGSRGGIFDDSGKIKGYRMRTRYVRQLDASIMTPDERLCEMTECALDDPHFSQKMKAQFGALANPVVLFQLAMVIGVFVGIGAGAEFIGGAAFAAGLMRLLGLGMVTHQVGGYVAEFETLRKCCFSDKQGDFTKGIQTVQKILIMAVTDIAMFVTMEGAMMVGSKAIGILKNLVTRYTPEEWLKSAEELMGQARHKVAQARARVYGFAAENLLKAVPNPGRLFQKGELDYFLGRSAKNHEMIVIRGPSAERMEWLTKLQGWLEGKSEWIKAKSWMGWNVGGRLTGLVGVPKAALDQALAKAGMKLQPRPPYEMGNLKGVFKEVDAYIDNLPGSNRKISTSPVRPSYEIPIGLKIEINVPGKGEMKLFDWDAARHKGADAQGYRLVDVGDTYLIVDPLGRPVCQDLDLGAIQRMGTPAGAMPGSHLRAGKINPEDDFFAQEMMNWEMAQANGQQPYNPIKHGGAGGSIRHVAESQAAGKKHWSARGKSGAYDAEELYAFLPVAGGGSKLFKFDGWAEFEQFWKANEQLIGSKWVF